MYRYNTIQYNAGCSCRLASTSTLSTATVATSLGFVFICYCSESGSACCHMEHLLHSQEVFCCCGCDHISRPRHPGLTESWHQASTDVAVLRSIPPEYAIFD